MTPKETVILLMKAAAPERNKEIIQLWGKYGTDVWLENDAVGITMNANKQRIAFDSKTTDIFWLMSFSAWRSIECYAPHVILSASCNKPLEEIIESDKELAGIEKSYKERFSAARSLIKVGSSDFIEWPPDIPRPMVDIEFENVQHQAAFDLACLSLSFALLHEFRHVMLGIDGERHQDMREEELECDVWARRFMTEKLNLYASLNSYEYHKVLQKRSMGLAIAALILHEITPTFEHGGNSCYFPIKVRLQAILDNTPLPEESYFWILMASLLTGLFRQKHIPIDCQPMPPHLLASHLLNRL